MLDLRPSCEHCDADLPPDALDARICTYECTFCAACADGLLGGVCPNCAGELVARPVRPDALLIVHPPSTDRVHHPADLDAHKSMLATRALGADHGGVPLRRYVDAWLAGDLATVVDGYDESFTLHYAGAHRFAGTHVGRDAALAVLAEVSVLAPRELVSVDEVLVGDRGAAVAVTERLARDGESAEVRRLLRYRIAGGRFVECWLHELDPAVVDHFWR